MKNDFAVSLLRDMERAADDLFTQAYVEAEKLLASYFSSPGFGFLLFPAISAGFCPGSAGDDGDLRYVWVIAVERRGDTDELTVHDHEGNTWDLDECVADVAKLGIMLAALETPGKPRRLTDKVLAAHQRKIEEDNE